MGKVSAIVFDGKKYLPSVNAADLVGYTKDYVGQLARAGKIESRIVGRSWYIAEDSILAHKKTVHYTLTKKKKPRKTNTENSISREKEINFKKKGEKYIRDEDTVTKDINEQKEGSDSNEIINSTSVGIGFETLTRNRAQAAVMPSVHEAFMESGAADGLVVGRMLRTGPPEVGNSIDVEHGAKNTIPSELPDKQTKNLPVPSASVVSVPGRTQVSEGWVTPAQRTVPAAPVSLVPPLPPKRRPGFMQRAHLEHDVHFEQGQPLFFEDDRPVFPEPVRLTHAGGKIPRPEHEGGTVRNTQVDNRGSTHGLDVAVSGGEHTAIPTPTVERRHEHRDTRGPVSQRGVPTADGIVVTRQYAGAGFEKPAAYKAPRHQQGPLERESYTYSKKKSVHRLLLLILTLFMLALAVVVGVYLVGPMQNAGHGLSLWP